MTAIATAAPQLAPLRIARPPLRAVTLPVLGIPTRFESNSPAVLETAEQAFGAWRVLDGGMADADPARVRINVADGDEGDHEHAPCRYTTPVRSLLCVATPGSRGRADATRREAVARVTRALVADAEHFRASILEALTIALLTRLDREPLHAAALVRRGPALLVSAPSGVGKSTLAYGAMRSGLRVMAEDAVYLQLRPFRVWGMPGHVHLLPSSSRFYPELEGMAPVLRPNGKIKVAVRVRGLGAAPRPVAERAGVCLLRRGSGPRPVLERLDPAEVARALTEQIEPGFHLFAGTIRERIHRLAQGGGWRLSTAGHPDETIPLLHDMFDVLEGGR